MHIIYSNRHRQHDASKLRIHGEEFPEVPARAAALLAAVTEAQLGPVVAPEDHGQQPLLAVHPPDYLHFLQTIHVKSVGARHASGPHFLADTFATRSARRASAHPWALIGRYSFDIEAPFLEGTWEAAYWSAQCALSGAGRLLAGDRAAYALCRPPGHHALADQAGGFCYLNNAAIAARYLQGDGDRRIAILDFDYHHGNGTQEIFYRDSSVLFISLHAHPDNDYPFYWGAAEERGDGGGEGFNLNLPLPRGVDDAGYLAALEIGLDAIRKFAPRYLVVSAGFDIALGDPSALGGGFEVTVEGMAGIGQRIAALALPTLIIQEGGYGLDRLGQNAVAFLRSFA
ncbi:MAG: histone deacetylase family protein [Anaerolineales bacterium]